MSTPAEATSTTTKPPAGPRRLARALALVGGTAAALVVWALAKYAFDIEMQARQPGGTGPADITAVHVISSAVPAVLVGWLLLAILERFAAKARTIWTWIAVVVTILSLASPAAAQDATGDTKISLALMHIAVAAVVIPIFARTSPRS